jgi:3-oxoacyl-[acyl-carrier-protein] synthase II
MKSRARVAVTGLGILSALGANRQAFQAGLLAGQPAFTAVTRFDSSPYRTRLAGQVTLPLPQTAPGQDRCSLLALAATREALAQADLNLSSVPPDRLGVAFGTCFGSDCELEEGFRQGRGAAGIPPQLAVIDSYSPALAIVNEIKAAGPVRTVGTACAAGLTAIGVGMDLISSGRCDVVIAGGADALNEVMFCGFNSLRSLSVSTCRPFDAERDGLLLGEGAAILVLESEEHLRRRGAEPLGYLLGYGISNDAYHPTAPDPEGGGAQRAMAMALAESGLQPEAVDYIAAHGTGTPHNDAMEVTAVRRIFGNHAERLAMSSLKSMAGHTMGAAGAMGVVASLLAIREGFLPPTFGLQSPIDTLDFVPEPRTGVDLRVAMSNAFAFGGHCASLLVGRVDL